MLLIPNCRIETVEALYCRMSGGVVPVAAMVAKEEAFAPFDRDPHIHSATFAGAGIAAVAAQATVEVLAEDDVPALASRLGEQLRSGLEEALQTLCTTGIVCDIRGRGLLIGIECETPQAAGELEMELIARRVIPNHCLNHHAVVRLTPPAYMSDSEIQWLLWGAREASAALVAQKERQTAKRRRG